MTMLITIICTILTIGYVLLMSAYKKGWKRQRDFILLANYQPSTFISVIIPARNEARNIDKCITSILAQEYPAALFEIIIVDDHSDDGTTDIVKKYADKKVRCISLADYLIPGAEITAYKKAAIAAGIAQSRGKLIITTDADCIAPALWLMNMAAIYEQEQPVMIVAPVIYLSDRSIIQIFQLIDFMSMQGITAAAHNLHLGNMSNGANLAFSKAAYEEVSGYVGIDHLASGDDYLLMMKMNKRFPARISYLRSPGAIISTTPQPDWNSFLQQRIRWASKSGKYNDARLTGILLLVYLFNVSLMILSIAAIVHPVFFYILLIMLAIKIVVEYLFLISVANFFNKEWALKYFPSLQPLHILYIVMAGFLGFIGSYKWKDRKVK